ncbi:uncharacterized protein B0H18DRAFT_867140 [Fomitopsis serialis]|uniref:uncharacterized protein n=1 Tax=Fomitopsis serialis TaxID=139415 RepID=UPI0020088684|nr:uncharacterized protein B0H18DRAFT_867140 [Neoantrodia serialis]KAH9937110.1 hypothetical protein B0H18DRAFT_867140 [Neoantrodia serialis]
MAQDEIKRLAGKLTRQEERIEELRDIHRLESKSQSDQIDKLRAHVDEAEALLKATSSSTTRAEEESAKRKADIERLQTEMDRMKGAVKDEEEKRVKAVGLLKTVRQKLVKAEKERDDALKDIQGVRDKDKGELEKERAEKAELKREIERATAERETALNGLKAHFDKEVAALKEKHEKELAAIRSQFELEAITTKTSLVKDIENRDSRITDLQSLVRSLEGEKDEFFDQLQLRQAELESSRSRLESLEGQTTEFQYQLREANERIALLTEELSDARREQETKALNIGPSAEHISRLLSAAESKYEARISDLRSSLSTVEREREESEALWSRKLADKSRELDSLRDVLNSSARSREQESENVGALKEDIVRLKEEVRTYQLRISDTRIQAERAVESENGLKSQISDLNARITALQQLLEEGKAREAQLRAHHKTLREELRKVQSSAALLERQRNPGVGYWASRQDPSGERSPRSSIDGRDTPSRPSSPALSQSDEELNIEYLRNVILQFLEHKEMRPHLVRILSTILRFTPQETRRLVSKV